MITRFQAALGSNDLWTGSDILSARVSMDTRQFDVVLLSEVVLARNIAGRHFPAVQDFEEAIEVVALVEAVALGIENDSCRLVQFGASDPEESVGILKERQIFDPRRLETEGFTITPPLVKFYLAEDSHRLIQVNVDDHIRLVGQSVGLDSRSALANIQDWDERLGAELGFSASIAAGYHTSRVIESGSGMRVRFLLHIPALAWAEVKPDLEPGCRLLPVEAAGLPPGTGLFWFEMPPCGSEPEDVYLSRAERVAAGIVIQERRLREDLRSGDQLSFDDRAERGLGLMTHHRTIGLEEAYQLWGRVRTAAAMGILPPPEPAFTGLAFRMLPHHVALYAETAGDNGIGIGGAGSGGSGASRTRKGSSKDQEMTILNQARSLMIRECFSGG